MHGTGTHLGYQQYENENAYAAADVEVTVDTTTGVIRVHRAGVAHDCGLISNPPSVETIVIDRRHEPALGAGEPAIGNAVFHAVGIRLRSLPMALPKVLEALAAT